MCIKVICQSDRPPERYRWVPLKPDFLGAWKSAQLKHYLAYPIIIISLIIQKNLATKIWVKWESSLTAVWLKWDPPVDDIPDPWHRGNLKSVQSPKFEIIFVKWLPLQWILLHSAGPFYSCYLSSGFTGLCVSNAM